MNYNEFIATFKKQVHALAPRRRLDFALTVCKKLYFDYQNFFVLHKWGNPDLLMYAINVCGQANGGSLEKEKVEVILTKVEAITPDMDDFGDEISSYGLNACVAVQYTLEYLLTGDPIAIFYVGTCLTDTIELKVQEGQSLTEEEIDSNPLVRETRKQLLDQTS